MDSKVVHWNMPVDSDDEADTASAIIAPTSPSETMGHDVSQGMTGIVTRTPHAMGTPQGTENGAIASEVPPHERVEEKLSGVHEIS